MCPSNSTEEPILLAVDAGTHPPSVALMRGERQEAVRFCPAQVHTDAWLPAAIDDCLREVGHDLQAVEGFAVTVGPGTFTGIRVGLATCMGLAAPLSRPVSGVLTLEALAEANRRDGWVAPCIDARRGQVYAALYDLQESVVLPFEPAWGPAVCDPEELLAALAARDVAARVVGSGTIYFEDAEGRPPRRISEAPGTAPPGPPLAVPAGRLVARTWEHAGGPAGHPPEPLYLRAADARLRKSPLLE